MTTIQNSVGMPAARQEPAPRAAPVEQSATAAQPEQPKAHEPAAPKVDFDPKKMQQQLNDAVDHLNKMMEDGKRGLGFSVDNKLNMTIVTVKDTNTGEVVRQIPSEAVIRVAHQIEDLKGVLYSKNA